MTTQSIAEIVKNLILEFIEYPDKLNVEETVGKSSVIIGITSTEKSDISQIIGKKGGTITSIKKIIELIAHRRNVRCTIYVDKL
jgi:predicted RNA-binding protein YlqC (UPF0109 family)